MQTEKNTNNKIELSLSSIMFFSPLIQNLLKKNNNISPEEKVFIKWFIKVWYFNITLLITTIVLQIIYYMTKTWVYQTFSIAISSILALSLLIGSIYAISNKAIIKTKTQSETKENNKLELLLNYIPIYNIYLWYKKHDFENPDTILKESIIIRWLYSIIFITANNPQINRTILIILLVRIIMLMNDINYWEKMKNFINKLFKKNPEELRWYITWTVAWIFGKKTIKESINTQKNKFELLFKTENKQTLLEYIILFGAWIYWLYHWYVSNNLILMFSILFITSRYIIMIIKWNHVPHIPVLRWITQLFFKRRR